MLQQQEQQQQHSRSATQTLARTHLSKPEAVGTVGTGGRLVAEGAAGLEGSCLPTPSPGIAAGATAASGATIGPPLAASAAAVFC